MNIKGHSCSLLRAGPKIIKVVVHLVKHSRLDVEIQMWTAVSCLHLPLWDIRDKRLPELFWQGEGSF